MNEEGIKVSARPILVLTCLFSFSLVSSKNVSLNFRGVSFHQNSMFCIYLLSMFGFSTTTNGPFLLSFAKNMYKSSSSS